MSFSGIWGLNDKLVYNSVHNNYIYTIAINTHTHTSYNT